MFRARKLLESKIPETAGELCHVLPTTNFVATVIVDGSDKLYDLLANLMGHFTAFLNNFINCGLFFYRLGNMPFQPFTACELTKMRS